MQRTYPQAHVYINSIGGNVATCLEMIAILKKFDHVVTISTSSISSAGFLLWSVGDLRVVVEHTSIMHHRESYMFGGKTQQHADYAKHAETVFQMVYDTYLKDLITVEEHKQASYTEVYFSGVEMLERGLAIHYDEFIRLDGMSHVEQNSDLMKINDVYCIVDINGDARIVEDIKVSDEIYSVYDLIYGVIPTKITEVPDNKELLQENTQTKNEEVS
jgi:hypothetical protein